MTLFVVVVVDVGDREGARIFDSGRLPFGLWIFPPDGGQPAADPRNPRGLGARL
jgi:hypothetical protein